jgi:RNA polymerase sigma-70 factor (ECF subfamily)
MSKRVPHAVDIDARQSPPAAEAAATAELAWVRAAIEGDAAAFARLHARFRGMVRGIALGHVGWPEADDVVQDVFLRAWERLPQLRDPRRFAPWLARIARNRCVDSHRRPRPADSLQDRGAAMPPHSEALEVLRAIQTLPKAYRETLIMRLVEGMSGPEIAARTGLTPRSVRVNLHRGMIKLRAALGETKGAGA